jgi:predicted ATP-dependent serine protease
MTWRFVGRQSEMQRLEGLLAGARPHSLLIRGAMGIGKSRLLTEFADRAAERGWVVERVVGSASSSAMSMGALVQMLPNLSPGSWDAAEFQKQTR